MELVDLVFSNFLPKGVARKNILDLMEQFGLIAKFSSSKTGEKYFVPSQLKTPPDSLCSMAPTTLESTLVPCLFTSSAVLFPLVCSLGLFLDLSVGVLKLVQLSPLPCTKMERGLLLGSKLSMILFLFVRSSSLSSLSSKETNPSLWMAQVRLHCVFVSLWRQLCKLCHVISIKVDCSIIFGSPVRIVSGKSVQGMTRWHVLMKIVFISLS